MKKYLFMCLAMICMAFSAVVLISCGGDDEKKDFTGYSGTAKVTIYDPQKQLTDDQVKFLNNYINSVGKFDIGYVSTEAEYERMYKTWANNMDKNIEKFIENNPEVLETNAGIVLEADGPGGKTKITRLFKDMIKKQDNS